MKKHFGKITVITILLLLATVATMVGYMATKANAAETYTNTYMFKNAGNFDYTYPEIVFVEWPSGNVADVVTGIASSSETWEDNDITPTQHSESDFHTFTTPPLASNKEWVMCICNAASADGSVETDTMKCFFYSPSTNRVTDGSIASTGGGIYTRPTPTQ